MIQFSHVYDICRIQNSEQELRSTIEYENSDNTIEIRLTVEIAVTIAHYIHYQNYTRQRILIRAKNLVFTPS
jgi:hypothetical protein